MVTDFASDCSFAKAAEKVKEHYSIAVSASSVRTVCQKHGLNLSEESEVETKMPRKGVSGMIAEFDGSQVPCVEIADGAEADVAGKVDKRKHRRVCWHEAKLMLARVVGSARSRYQATMEGIEKAAVMWRTTVIDAGAGRNTKVHCLGDGAPSIVLSVKEQFGKSAKFLLDFYHVSEYLAAASQSLANGESKSWLKSRQELLKSGRSDLVIEELRGNQESAAVSKADAVVRRAYLYLSNRAEYLDYKSALLEGLPIGSGEIESGHRSVVQSRLKIAGAWWKRENANKMLSLRVCRANGEWESYWRRYRQANC